MNDMLLFVLTFITSICLSQPAEWCEIEHAEMFGVVIEFQVHYVRNYNISECKDMCDYNRTDCNYIKFTQNQYSTECIFYKELDNLFQDYSIPEYANKIAMYRAGDQELGECPTPSPTQAPTSTPTKAPTGSPTAAPTAAPTTPSPTAAPTTAAPTSPPTFSPTLPPTTPAPTTTPTESAEEEDNNYRDIDKKDLNKRWWFWTLVAAAILIFVLLIVVFGLGVYIHKIRNRNPVVEQEAEDPENQEVQIEVR